MKQPDFVSKLRRIKDKQEELAVSAENHSTELAQLQEEHAELVRFTSIAEAENHVAGLIAKRESLKRAKEPLRLPAYTAEDKRAVQELDSANGDLSKIDHQIEDVQGVIDSYLRPAEQAREQAEIKKIRDERAAESRRLFQEVFANAEEADQVLSNTQVVLSKLSNSIDDAVNKSQGISPEIDHTIKNLTHRRSYKMTGAFRHAGLHKFVLGVGNLGRQDDAKPAATSFGPPQKR